MTARAVVTISAFVLGIALIGHAESDEADRIRKAGVVLGKIMAAPDKAIPSSVLEKAEAVAIFPSTIKAAFVVGVQRGKGVISVRDRTRGEWSPPAS
jgi:lipid-binding SYLF domain-containing protein